MLFSSEELFSYFPKNIRTSDSPFMIQEVNTDSRKKSKNSLFIPIAGDTFNGHHYIDEAIKNGAIAALWEEGETLPKTIPVDFPIFLVADTIQALQKLAYEYRQKVNPIVIGITGSNGKTTTKDLTASILKTTYQTHATEGNLNNHIGLPLTILSMPSSTEVLVVEMGMNHFGEIDRLSKIARPDFAVITNIGESHIENLGSREGILQAKLELLHGLKDNGMLIIDGDEPLLSSFFTKSYVMTCGFDVNNKIRVDNVQMDDKHTRFRVCSEEYYTIPLLGKHHAKNATYAFTIAKKLNVSIENIQKGFSSLNLPSMRFEFLEGKKGVTIINDAYNASPTSMKASIDVVRQMENYSEKVLVLGDILELGTHAKELHESIASTIQPPITAVFTYGKHIKYLHDVLIENNNNFIVQYFESKEDLVETLKHYLREDTLLLFKASRGMKFEKIISKLL